MVFTTVLDALKALLDAGTYAGLTATFYIFMAQDPTSVPIKELDQFKYPPMETLGTNKVVGLIVPDNVCKTVPNWQAADTKRYDGTILLGAVSFNNMADFIEDIMKVGTDLKTSLLRFNEPAIEGEVENALLVAEMRYGWEKIVAHG